jgi:SAM-dependent methyltransferase
MASGYEVLPAVYDRWQKSYGKDFSELILPKLLSTIRRHRISGDSLVDVACGTGSLALSMARRGWKVAGIDASQGMIDVAKKKFRDARLPATFLVEDMRDFSLPAPVSLATSFFDGLNHLLEKEGLLSAFRAVSRSLVPGGWFVFDMNNEQCFTHLWTKNETIDLDGVTLTLESAYDRGEKLGTCVARLLVGGEEKTERVAERCYAPETVRALLNEAGFEVRGSEDFNFTPNPLIGKLKTWWVAEKAVVSSP